MTRNSEEFKKIYGREQNEEEKQKTNEMIKMIEGFNKKVYNDDKSIIPGEVEIKYLDDLGYFAIVDGDWGRCLTFDMYGKDKFTAFYKIINDLIALDAVYYADKKRYELFLDFKKRYGEFDLDLTKYERIYSTEHLIETWDEYFDNKTPLEIINFYEDFLNRISVNKDKGITWKYNLETKKFECKKDIKIKTLK